MATTADVKALAALRGIQVLDADLEPIAATISRMQEVLAAARKLPLDRLDPPVAFAPGGLGAYPGARTAPAAWAAPAGLSPVPAPSVRTGVPQPELTIAELSELIRTRQCSPVELTQTFLDRIAAHDPTLRTFITVTAERALSDARRSEDEVMHGQWRGPLHGIPIGHKDMIQTRGIRTTYHSRVYQDFVPEVNAAVVDRLDAAGTVLLGKLNTYELGHGDGDVFGLACNPWDPACQTAGSSSGSAAAVAARLVAGATGSDSGGSIRVPASFCGVVGLKPTYGWVSRFPDAWCSAGSTGPITRTALDAAIILQAMAGHDPRTRESADVPVPDFVAGLALPDLRGIRLGLPEPFCWEAVHPEVEAAVRKALRTLETLGAEIVPIAMPNIALAEDLGSIINATECSGRYRSWLVEHAAELGTFSRRQLTVGEFFSSRDYMLAQRVRGVIINDFINAHEQVDVVVTPSVPYPPFPFGQTQMTFGNTTLNPRTALGRFSRLSNLTGLPAISVPCGFTATGLPIGLQLMGRAFADGQLLAIAHRYQTVTDWHSRVPALS